MNNTKLIQEPSVAIAARETTEALLSQKEEIIQYAIDQRLGKGSWTMESLVDRLHSENFFKTYETYFLDGKALVQFGEPFQVPGATMQEENTMVLAIKYRIF